MIRVTTLGMTEKNAKLDPSVLSDVEAGTIQGYIHTPGSDGKADAPVAGTSEAAQTANLYVALNDATGDERNRNGVVPYGSKLNSFLLKAWNGQQLLVDEDNIVYVAGEDYDTIVANATVLVANTDGKLIPVDGTNIDLSNYQVAFRVVRKTSIEGKDAVNVKIDVGTQTNITTYNVTYDDNGGTGSVPEDTTDYRHGVTVAVDFTAESLPTRTGYTFGGWATAADATAADYEDGGTESFAMGAANVTLYAFWEAIDYSVTYDANGADSGDVPVDAEVYNIGDTATVSFTHDLVKDGYTFIGWDTNDAATSATYMDGGTETFEVGSSDVTLYAIWGAVDYNVTYNGNGADSGDVPVDATTYNIGDTVTVSFTHTLVKSGFTMSGWATTSDATVADYASGGTESFTMGSANVTLYAVWTA